MSEPKAKKVKPDIRAITRLVPPSGNLVQGQSELPIDPELAKAAAEIIAASHNHYGGSEGDANLRKAVAEKIAHALDYVRVLAVEMFVVAGNGGPKVLVNEIAPRVHNSGHWTLDGASISQFEQHIRAIAGWPLGKPIRHGKVTMTNLIGDDILSYEEWLTVPGATVHLYGKGSPRPGRKMGHVTEVTPAGKK